MNKLSYPASLAWKLSAGEAAAAQNRFIEREHILIGICSLEKLLGANEEEIDARSKRVLEAEREAIEDVLGGLELESARVRRQLRKKLGKGGYQRTEKVVHRSEACKRLFARAGELGTPGAETTCLHLLAAIMEEPGETISTLLAEMGVKPENLRARVLVRIGAQQAEDEEPLEVHPGEPALAAEGTHFLDRYGRDLTEEARQGKLGPFIGRREELLQVIQTLARRSKNNPVLVGEAGVGKTAIVEALALRVVEGKDANILAGKRIVELNMGALVGGTKYRGEFEDRLSHLIEEVRANPEVILFIDEIHTVVGAGRAEGSMDAGNLMKPALARGELRCIGATTIAEYRRYFESDPALERRFEKIIVNEPSAEEALAMLEGLRQRWEEHHQVHITDEALQVAVDLSVRFDGDHQLPDKAIDLVDKAGARARVPVLSMKLGAEPLPDDLPEEVGSAPAKKAEGRKRKKTKETEPARAPGVAATGVQVTGLTIAQVLSEKIGVPLEVISGHLEGMSQSRLLDLQAFLQERVVGQDAAVERVCQRLLMAHAGLVRRRGPLAVFLFLGPTGVGKTELARSLAGFLFGNEADLIRLDMSEYMEEHSVAKLVGSPPGYVGHEQEGQLTGKLRTKPYSVVLLDEIEKANPRVFDLFLQVFDEGRLTDSKGRTADSRNAIFVMTSNIPADKHLGFGFQDSGATGSPESRGVGELFRREFINRIDEQIVFRSLDEDDVQKILRPMLATICSNVGQQHGVVLEVAEEAQKLLARAGYSFEYGVRELQRTVERLLQVPLSRVILSGDLKKHGRWRLARSDEELLLMPFDEANEQP